MFIISIIVSILCVLLDIIVIRVFPLSVLGVHIVAFATMIAVTGVWVMYATINGVKHGS